MEENNALGGLTSAPIEPIYTSTDAMEGLKGPIPIVTPHIPDGLPTLVDINTQLQGDFNTGPKPSPTARNVGGSKAYVDALVSRAKNTDWNEDQYAYTRSSSYGAGYKNLNFNRYYKHNQFSNLGFNPYRDNESLYNEKGSWWDDFARASGQTVDLAITGFASALPGSSLWGDASSWNEEMEESMATGMSSRGGVGGWITNFGLNTGYTIGIASEMAIENLVLGALTVGSGGTLSEFTVPTMIARTGANALKLGKLGKAVSGTLNAIKQIQNIDKAWDVYTFAKSASKGVVNFINPLESTTELISSAIKSGDGASKVFKLANMSKTFGAFYNDARQINLAFSESMLEGEGAKSKYNQSALDAFYAKNGRLPNMDEAEKIYQDSENVKLNTTLANFGIIHATNKLVFDELLDRSRLANKMGKALAEGDKRLISAISAKEFKASSVPRYLLNEAKTWSTKGALKSVINSRFNPISLKYFAQNLGEAIQESAQETISSGMVDYQNRITSDPAQQSWYNFFGSIAHGLGEQVSLEGLNTFVQGYLTGGVLAIGQKALTSAYDKASDYISKKDTAEERQKAAEKRSNDIINSANTITKNALYYDFTRADKSVATKLSAEEAENSRMQGDTKGEKDFSFQTLLSHVHTLATSGSTSLITNHVDDMLALDDKSFSEAYEIEESNVADAKSKLKKLKDLSVRYDKQLKLAKEKFPNLHKPWELDPEKNPSQFQESKINYLAHESAIEMLLFDINAIDDVASRMTSIYDTFTNKKGFFGSLFSGFKNGRPFSEVNGEDIGILLDHDQRGKKMSQLSQQIALLNNGTDQQKAEAKVLQEQYDLLSMWNRFSDNHAKMMASENKATWSTEEATRRKNYSIFRNGARVKNKKSGDEYDVVSVTGDGKAVIKNEKGEEKQIDRYTAIDSYDVVKESNIPNKYAGMGDDVSTSLEFMYDAYNKYLEFIARTNNVQILDESKNTAFEMLRDFYLLSNEYQGLTKTVNILSDPKYFSRMVAMNRAIQQEKENQRIQNLERAIQTVKNRNDKNFLINRLLEQGIIVAEEDLVYLDKDDLRGPQNDKGIYRGVLFYDVASKKPIGFADPKFKDILDTIEKYEQDTQKTVLGKPLDYNIDDANVRMILQRYENDDRTYKDLANQFGFDPSAESSEVDIVSLLKSIIDSTLSSSVQIILARRMLPLFAKETTEEVVVNPEDSDSTQAQSKTTSGPTIVFDKSLSTMIEYDSETGVLSINPKYASEDYIQQNVIPMEFLILNGLLRKLMFENLATNTEFNNEIDEIRKKTIEYIESKGPEYKSRFDRFGRLENVSFLNDNLFFAIEAVTNPEFQKILASVQIEGKQEGKPSSIWKQFLEVLIDAFSEILQVDINSTALTAVLSTVGVHLDAMEKFGLFDAKRKAAEGVESVTEEAEVPVSIESMPSALLDQLVLKYRELVKGDTDVVPNSEASREEIVNSDKFKNMLSTSPSMQMVIDSYYQKGPQETKIPVTPKEEEPVSVETLGFENLGDVGNQGLAIMESDINKSGKHVISNISKASPEQRAKIDSDIEELKKKYPEKNITSKVENDKLIIETSSTITAGTFTPTTPYGTPTGPELTTATPVSTDTKVDVEAEIANIEAEINDIKRKVYEENSTKELRYAKVGDVLYAKNGNVYRVISKKDKYGRSLEYELTKEDGTIIVKNGTFNPLTVSNSDSRDSFARQKLYSKPYSKIQEINAEYQKKLDVLEAKLKALTTTEVETTVTTPSPVTSVIGGTLKLESTKAKIGTRDKYGPVEVTRNANGDVVGRINTDQMIDAFDKRKWSFPKNNMPFLPPETFNTYDTWLDFAIKFELTKNENPKLKETNAEYLKRITDLVLNQMGITVDVDTNRFYTTDSLMNAYDAIKDENDIQSWEEKTLYTLGISELLLSPEGGYVLQRREVDKMVKTKKEELAKRVEWNLLKVGKTVVMTNGEVRIVSSKGKNSVDLKLPEGTSVTNVNQQTVVTVGKEDIKNQIKLINNPFIKDMETERPPVTTAEKEASNAVVKDIFNMSDEDFTDVFDSIPETDEDVSKLKQETENAFKTCNNPQPEL